MMLLFSSVLHNQVMVQLTNLKPISVVTVFLFQVSAGVSSGAPSSSSSTLDTVDPGLEDYCVPINKAGLTFHRALRVMCL